MKDFPHTSLPGDDEPERLPKSPLQKDVFPECEPEGCTRGCHRFYMAHTRTISFAMYATQDPTKNPRKVCVYAFSCGDDLLGERVELAPGETPEMLLKRVVPILLKTFVERAEEAKVEHAVRDN